MFNGKRLRIARYRNKKTQRELATAVRLNSVTVARHESGALVPTPETVELYASELKFDVPFFFGEDVDEASEDSASFRSLSTMLSKEKHAALAASSLAFLLLDWVENKFDLPETQSIDGIDEDKPAAAARIVREMWSLGEMPIGNIIHLLESKGFRVFSLSENTRSVDAYSLWRRGCAYIFLNTMKTGEHSRMDAAHELGHLVMHRHGAPNGRLAEDQAKAFASEFLMPEPDVRAELSRVYSLEQLIRAKERWRVSLSALNYRVHKLGITSDWQYRSFCIQISEKGFRTSEPDGIRPETSAVWQQVFEMLRTEKVAKIDLARATGVPVAEIERLVFGLAPMLPMSGGGDGSGSGSRGALRLVQ